MSDTANLIQLYSDDAKTEKAYPICHKDGIFDEDGSNTIQNIEKK